MVRFAPNLYTSLLSRLNSAVFIEQRLGEPHDSSGSCGTVQPMFGHPSLWLVTVAIAVSRPAHSMKIIVIRFFIYTPTEQSIGLFNYTHQYMQVYIYII